MLLTFKPGDVVTFIDESGRAHKSVPRGPGGAAGPGGFWQPLSEPVAATATPEPAAIGNVPDHRAFARLLGAALARVAVEFADEPAFALAVEPHDGGLMLAAHSGGHDFARVIRASATSPAGPLASLRVRARVDLSGSGLDMPDPAVCGGCGGSLACKPCAC